MIKIDFKGIFVNLFYDVKDFFRCYKKYYIIFFVIMLVGLITGMLTAFKFAGEVEINNLNDKVLIDFLKGEGNVFILFIRRIFSFSILFFILYLINLKRFTCFLNHLLILYEAYILGINCAVFISLFSISGVINVFVIYLPCHLLILIFLMSLSTIFCSSCFIYRRFGENIFCQNFWQQNSKSIILILCFTFIVIILESILLPTFCNVFFIT